MSFFVSAISGLAAALIALAWAREFRLRRALQALLSRIFQGRTE